MVAVKVLHDAEVGGVNFTREIAILKGCRHSNIVQFQVSLFPTRPPFPVGSLSQFLQSLLLAVITTSPSQRPPSAQVQPLPRYGHGLHSHVLCPNRFCPERLSCCCTLLWKAADTWTQQSAHRNRSEYPATLSIIAHDKEHSMYSCTSCKQSMCVIEVGRIVGLVNGSVQCLRVGRVSGGVRGRQPHNAGDGVCGGGRPVAGSAARGQPRARLGAAGKTDRPRHCARPLLPPCPLHCVSAPAPTLCLTVLMLQC